MRSSLRFPALRRIPPCAAVIALAACGGAATTTPAPDAGSTQPDAEVAEVGTDGPAEGDTGTPADGGAAPEGGAELDGPTNCSTPASMFAAPIKPPVYAGIDFSRGGKGDVT